MRFQAPLAIIGLAMSVCACGGAGPTAPVVPATAGDLTSTLSTSFDALTIPANAACSISISQHGQVLLERGRGQVAPGRPASGDSLYRIASLTKPITASAVLMSERVSRLSRWRVGDRDGATLDKPFCYSEWGRHLAIRAYEKWLFSP